jgi:hypothetical protein
MLEFEMGTMDRLFDGADHNYYPAWVCSSCGAKYGRRRCGIATWHGGTCGICGIEARVTEPRDFGHLKPGWREQYEQEASNGEVRGASRPAGEASSAEGATSTVVLGVGGDE